MEKTGELDDLPSHLSGQVAGPFSASQRPAVGRLWESECRCDFECPEPSKKAIPSPPSIQSSNRDNMATKTAPQSNDLKFLGPMVDLTADVSNKGYDVASAIMQKMPQPVQQATNTANEKYITPVSQQVTGLLGNCVKTVDSSVSVHTCTPGVS